MDESSLLVRIRTSFIILSLRVFYCDNVPWQELSYRESLLIISHWFLIDGYVSPGQTNSLTFIQFDSLIEHMFVKLEIDLRSKEYNYASSDYYC
jgi:hypothetical protein